MPSKFLITNDRLRLPFIYERFSQTPYCRDPMYLGVTLTKAIVCEYQSHIPASDYIKFRLNGMTYMGFLPGKCFKSAIMGKNDGDLHFQAYNADLRYCPDLSTHF